MLEPAIHAKHGHLKKVVCGKRREIAQHADYILLLYGLCGSVPGKVKEDFRSNPCAVCILKEYNGDIMDDCIEAVP
ncbi:MAG: DUF1638 domain-containing protein [Methanosarcinaceae archaeon]|nr:DUF1638 domain-containing protein [Methanosarcinaceae archaeon]